MRRGITAREVPDEIVAAVADAVRLCRAADDRTTARDVIEGVRRMNPGMDEAGAVRAAGYAAMLLDR